MADVLIVDDDPDIRGMLRFILDDHGFGVREAGDGQQALDALADHAPDVLLLDLMMPNVDGFTVLETMRARRLASQTKVVILTCMADENSLVRGWELGAADYLVKPFDPDLLAAKLALL